MKDKMLLIDKVLSGRALGSEKLELAAWIDENPGNQAEYENLKLLHDYQQQTEADFHEGLHKIRILMEAKHRTERVKKLATALTILTGVIILGTAGFFFWQHQASASNPNLYVFQNDPLGRIIGILEKDNETHITVAYGEVLECRFSGTFYNVPLIDIIKSIADGLNLRYEVKDNGTYLLTGRSCLKGG